MINKFGSLVDASEAGVGNLEVAVNEGKIPSMAQSLGQHRYDISFVPKDDVPHTISVKFNNESVPGQSYRYCNRSSINNTLRLSSSFLILTGSPFTCNIASGQSITIQKISASGPGLERIPASKPAKITIDHQGEIISEDLLTAVIKGDTTA